MRIAKILSLATCAAVTAGATNLLAQAVDPNVAGPARRAVAGLPMQLDPRASSNVLNAAKSDAMQCANNGNPNAAARNERRQSSECLANELSQQSMVVLHAPESMDVLQQ